MPLVRSLEYRRPLVIRHNGATLTVRRVRNSPSGDWLFVFSSSPSGVFRAGSVWLMPLTTVAARNNTRVRVDHNGRSINLIFYHKSGCGRPRVSIDADKTWHVVPRELSPPLSGHVQFRRPLAG